MTQSNHRIESDTFGPIEVPADRLWGAQTQRSLEHFRISGERMPRELDPRAASWSSAPRRASTPSSGVLDAEESARRSSPPPTRCSPGEHDGEFPLVVWQTGSGTQTNMNVNEVLANRASELLGGERGEARRVHPNDDVNRGQSSNDVFPTAMHVAAARGDARTGCCRRWSALRDDARAEGRGVRRHRQDRPHAPAGRDAAHARPGVLRLRRAARRRRSRTSRRRCRTCYELALGGTAVGTGLNAHPRIRRARRRGDRARSPACRS